MSATHSDALVFFGATGDLAYQKIFPSLQAMIKRGNLDVPVIGVAKAGWNLDQMRAWAKDSLEQYGGLDRDVIQNHLFQVIANLAMEPPARRDSKSIRDEKVKVLKAIPPLDAGSVIRGQFAGYLSEPGGATESTTETFAALRLDIDSPRWKGVPFYVRAGKHLPVTCTEIVARFHRPPNVYSELATAPNHLRIRISPGVQFAIGMLAMADDEKRRRVMKVRIVCVLVTNQD